MDLDVKDTAQTKFLAYEISLSLLKGAGNAHLSEEMQMTVDHCITSMGTDSVVDAIVESLECRRTVLELSNRLGLANDPDLRTAMRTDEERIATFLVSILSSQSYEETVLRLEGDSAQHFLDVVQETLDRGFLTTQEHNRMALRIIRKLSESCDMLPTSLFIVGVHDRDEHPSFGGGFADVYRASYGNQRVALKRMRHFLRGSNLRRIHLKFCREALLWKDLHHPNILPFLGIDRDSFPSFLCMVSHWMDHGTVMNYLKTYGHANVDKLLYEIAQGLEYLHSHNIVHGDLRGANILIKQDWSACLTDFGLSTFSDATATMSTTRAGSFYWMAPELLLPERFGLKFARTPATDVYAFGCVCFELYTERPPFSAWPEPAVLMKVLEGERPERPTGPPMMTDTLWQHITDFLVESPPKRPSTPVLVQNMTWPRLVPHPSTPSAPLTAGNLPGPTPPATNESLLSSAVVSTAEETAILAHESSIPSLADADSPFLDPADLGIGTEMPNTLSEEEVTNATASELANPTAIVGDTYDAGNPYPPPMSTEKVLDTGAEQRGYASVPMNWPLVNAKLATEDLQRFPGIRGGIGGPGGVGQGPTFSKQLVSGMEGKTHSVPDVSVLEFCRHYRVSDEVRQLLEDEGFQTAGALFQVSDVTLKDAGFELGQIAELERALKEFMVDASPKPGRQAPRRALSAARPSLPDLVRVQSDRPPRALEGPRWQWRT